MIDFSIGANVDDFLLAEDAEFLAGFCAHPGKESGEAVVIVLRPLLERVMVALGTANADAQEQLSRGFGPLLGIPADLEEVGRAIDEGAALGGHNIAHEGIDRDVIAHLCPNPVVKAPHSLVLEGGAINPQEITPLERPPVDELRPFENLVDGLGSLFRIFVRQETAHFIRCRQRADGIEVKPAEELIIRAKRRWRETDVLPLGEQLDVNEVVGCDFRVLVQTGKRQSHLGNAGLAAKADHDVRFTSSFSSDEPSRRDRCHGIIQGIELSRGGDVLALAIGPDGCNRELLLLSRLHGARGREYLQTFDSWVLEIGCGAPSSSHWRMRL